MSAKPERYKRYIFMGILIIVLGISFSTTLKDSVSSLGIVFIAIGGLIMLIGMRLKRKDQKKNNT